MVSSELRYHASPFEVAGVNGSTLVDADLDVRSALPFVSSPKNRAVCGFVASQNERLHTVIGMNVASRLYNRHEQCWFRKVSPECRSLLTAPPSIGREAVAPAFVGTASRDDMQLAQIHRLQTPSTLRLFIGHGIVRHSASVTNRFEKRACISILSSVSVLRGGQVKAARVLQFGPPSVITYVDLPRPKPEAGQVLVRVQAAGVGNWDALIREGRVALQPLPIVLGSELSGIVEAIGTGVLGFKPGDEVYGATNEQFSGAYAEYALPLARLIAQKPRTLNFIQAASAPIVAVTASQMLFDYACATAGQTVLIHGAAGNVGAYAVQLANQAGLNVVATAASADMDYVSLLGAERVLDYRSERFEESLSGVDVVLDTVGGDTQERSLRVLKPGGILVSVVSPVPEALQNHYGVRAAYFYVDVTTARLNKIAELFDSGKLVANVGTVLPLEEARRAHEMLGGEPHKRGKIVLSIAA